MSVSHIPNGFHSVTPYLVVRGAANAIEFYKAAFGATEVMRLEMQPGVIGHAEILIGNSRVMLSEEFPDMGFRSPETLGGTPVSMMIYVADADELFDRALMAGARLLRPMVDQFYGDRSGMLADPFGHTWSIATHIEDVTSEEMSRRMADFMKSNSLE